MLGAVLRSNVPQFMFAAVPNPGVVDVFDMSGSSSQRVDADIFTPGLQSIPTGGVTMLMDYFRQ